MAESLILHDYYAAPEGGGRLCLELARGLAADPDGGAALAAGFIAPGHPFFPPDPVGAPPPHPVDLGLRSDIPLLRQIRLAHGFASGARGRLDVLGHHARRIVYSGFYAPLAVHRFPSARNVCYCHTPPRFLYDQRDFYRRQLPLPLRPLLDAFAAWLRPRYERAMAAMDHVVTNSEHVRRRILAHLDHLNLESRLSVVHPPCDTARFAWLGQDDHFLSMARLDPLKRVDTVIDAFALRPHLRLTIVSAGPDAQRIQRLAADLPNVTFRGPVSDPELRDLLGHCRATVYIPRDEDFGMSAIESMAAGKPVIAAAEGGLKETILPDATGALLPNPTPESLATALDAMTADRAASMRQACHARALEFDTARFLAGMRAVLGE